jgi:hypothetical protein
MQGQSAGQGGAGQGGPSSVSVIWSEHSWRRLETELAESLRVERERLRQRNARARFAARFGGHAMGRALPRKLGAHPAYWVLLAVSVLALLAR